MEKRYQVFVSSTFADLREERSRVIQTVMELDCIPAGMELFPAADEEQLAFIKRVIDDCDYYIVIVGGRYGSTTTDGVSFTEKEYEYALERGLKVIALLHEDPKALPVSKSEEDSLARQRLEAFRRRLAEGRLVKFWASADALPGLVALSLAKTIKLFPAQGWVRAGAESREALLAEIADLRRRNELQAAQLQELQSEPVPRFSDLASLDDQIYVDGTSYVGSSAKGTRRKARWYGYVSWRKAFGAIAPFLMDGVNESNAEMRLGEELFKLVAGKGAVPRLESQSFQTIKLQFIALGVVNIRQIESADGSSDVQWSLTPTGRQLMFECRVQRSNVRTSDGAAAG
jgi:hypothetical protein